ncbi:integrase [Amycolatopsis antarctica]|uniref:Integrase n=1 Tax=Amycolatopsis antarctica TaxID=1854586 RepID=A0A263D709_9PSEU|nr:tyrosine-type recombinase/integrase [Amycolatopsis antarctica]OZM73959.1 integrase [Amycolatopsis antarctica]
MFDTLADWLDEWQIVLDNGTVSAETTEVYVRGVTQFITWARDAQPHVTAPEHIDRRHIDLWLGHLTRQGRKEATRRVRLLAVRFWLDYLVDTHDCDLTVNPAARIPLPVPKDHPVPIIDDDSLAALLKATAGRDFFAIRDTAIIRLLLDTGVRRGEVVGIDVDDLDLRTQEVTVTGKGGKTRTLPIGGKTALALRKYLRVRATRPAATSKPLFLSYRASDTGTWRLTGGGVGEMIDRRCEAAGLGHVWPHQLRHTWAHDMLDNGASEGVVERLGGWTPGSKMVKRYGSSMADARARKASMEMARGDRV